MCMYTHGHMYTLTDMPSATFGASVCSRQGWPGTDGHRVFVGRKGGLTEMPVYRRPVLQAQRLVTSRHGSAGRRVALLWEVGRAGAGDITRAWAPGGNVGLHPDSRASEGS